MDEFKPNPGAHAKINILKKKKLPLVVIRDECWFFDMKCLYPKTVEEIEVEIKNAKYWMNEYEEFDGGYTCAPIYIIPHPDCDSFCFLCTDAMHMRRDDPNLGYGKPRRREQMNKDEPNENTAHTCSPSRQYWKENKYDPIIDSFMEGEEDLVEVNVSGIDAHYLRTQLNKRIETRTLRNVKVSVVNNVCYLEKK